MHFTSLLVGLALFLPFAARAQAVLIDESAPVPQTSSSAVTVDASSSPNVREESKNGSYLTTESRLRDLFKGGEYDSLVELRSNRRIGIGAEAGGRLGVVGMDVDVNFGPLDSATAGFGGGPGYNGLSMGWKHLFGGHAISPYASMALTRWSSGGGSSQSGSTTPGLLGDKFLTAQEKSTGRFAKNFVVPAAGLQYFELEGRSAGASLYAEVLMLVETSTGDTAPTAGLGAMYYF